MADTAQFVTTIKVRDLISAFESKSESVKVEFSRPRAKSVGNILPKNVIVRQNEFNTLDDVEKALRKLDANLNFYEVYNKAKHVAFQEQLFNILTSIVNIESDAEDATVRRKKLISQTQTLVSFLNQKLPSNIDQVISSPPSNQFKYTTYSSYAKENGAVESDSTKDIKYIPYSEITKTVDVTDSSTDAFVSVRKLKETFQPKNEDVQISDKKFKTEYTVNVADPITSNGYKQEQPKQEPIPDEEKHNENVSVSRLRNLFEQKSEESAKGLGMIADDKAPVSNPAIGNFTNTINFPYTERNLGNVRLQRSASGNYMNYVGLLKRTDINRSKSVHELNKKSQVNVRVTKKFFDDDSGAESDRTLEDEGANKNVGEVKIKRYAASSEDLGKITRNDTYNLEKDDVPAISVKEIIVKYSTNTNTEVQKIEHKNVEKSEYVTSETSEEAAVNYHRAISDNLEKATGDNAHTFDKEDVPIVNVKELVVKYSSNVDTEDQKTEYRHVEENESTVKGLEEIGVTYSTAISVDVNQEPAKEQQKEHVSTVGGVQEINVSYLRADNISIPNNENVASVKGIEEVNVPYSTATSDNIETTTENDTHNLEEEDVPAVNVKEMIVKYSSNIVDVNQEPDKEQQENVSTVDGVQEVLVNYLRAKNTDNPKNESVASVKGIEEVNVPYSTATSTLIKQDSNNLHREDIASIKGAEEKEIRFRSAESVEVSQNENVATIKGASEEDVNYSVATSDDIKQDVDNSHQENISSTEGIKEIELRYEVVESKNISKDENVANLNGADEVTVNYSTATSDDTTQTKKENVVTFEGAEETIVNYSTAESKNVLENENIANIHASQRETVTDHIIGTVPETIHSSADVTDNVSTTATIGSEDYNRDAAFTEEEIDKIDVEQTLANEDIVLNAEDLKNAEDEFEKLLETSEKEKTTS